LESAKNVPVSQSKVEITKIVLEPVPFNFNESSIQMANLSLDSVIQIMKANPNVRLLVIAHTDSRGSYTYNKNLSRKRAASVSLHLNSRGISSSRIKLLAMGEEQLLNKCTDGLECAEEEHAVNRRVELKLIK
jgi:peptidoglycan-associated lipoprotein